MPARPGQAAPHALACSRAAPPRVEARHAPGYGLPRAVMDNLETGDPNSGMSEVRD